MSELPVHFQSVKVSARAGKAAADASNVAVARTVNRAPAHRTTRAMKFLNLAPVGAGQPLESPPTAETKRTVLSAD